MMADHRLDLAEALLAKARSTSFEGERQSFVAGAHHQLSAFLGSDAPVQRRPGERAGAAPALARRPAASLSAPEVPAAQETPAPSEPEAEPVLVVDLAAAERAYRSHSGRAVPGVLVDLAI